jgi:hypothetical protein
MRHLTDVEIEARIATRTATLTTRVRRLELALSILLPALDALAQDGNQTVYLHALDEARQTLGPPR